MTVAQFKRIERVPPANDPEPNPLEAAYRAAASIHFPNMDAFTMVTRVRLMAQRDRAGAALSRCCPEAINTLVEANRLAALAALSGAPTRTLAFVSSAVDSLIFAAEQLHRGQP
jgi:hypothetical protein